MAISRPLLLALIGAVLAAATFFVATNAHDVSTDGTTAVVPATAKAQAQAPAAKPAAATLSAGETLKAALSTPPVKSGRFEGSASVSGTGSDGSVSVSGRFQLAGPTDMPKLDVELSVDGAGKDVDAGFVSTGDKGYLVSDGTAYQLPEEAWSQAVQARTTPNAGQAAPTLASLGLDPSSWVRNVKDEGTEEVDGVETKHVTATIDAAAALRDVSKAAGGAATLPPNAAAGVKDASLDAWVGTEDKIIRRVTADVGVGKATIKLDFRLSEVNDPQTIDTPDKVSDTLPAGLLGGAAPAFTQGLSLATGASPKALELPANNYPQRLDRAVGDHREVVLFFHQERGFDDQATAEAVRALDRRTRVLVLSDDVRNADRYGKLVEDLGVSQAPSIVIVDRKGKARLIEGYIDAESLVQEVSDAR
jgi:hypothetical protein